MIDRVDLTHNNPFDNFCQILLVIQGVSWMHFNTYEMCKETKT